MEGSTKPMSDQVYELKMTRTVGGMIIVAFALALGTCGVTTLDEHRRDVAIKRLETERAVKDTEKAASETERARIMAERDVAVIEQMKRAEKK
jgi:hypothetical protein